VGFEKKNLNKDIGDWVSRGIEGD